MAANEQQSVPVWDSRADRYCGTLTTTDLLQLILLCSGMFILPCSLSLSLSHTRSLSGIHFALLRYASYCSLFSFYIRPLFVY
jgi:hypothetical protein